MKFATTKERIIYYIDYKGITVKEFLEETAIKRGFLDSDKLNSVVSDVFLAKIIAKYTDLDLEWLITGKGEMLKGEPFCPPDDSVSFKEYVMLLKKSNNLHEENKELLAELHQLKNLLGLNEGSIIKSPNLHGVTDTDNTGLVAPKKELKKQ